MCKLIIAFVRRDVSSKFSPNRTYGAGRPHVGLCPKFHFSLVGQYNLALVLELSN